MKNTRITSLLIGLLALGGAIHAADRIELTDGSVVIGKLLSAEGGKFKVKTGFAGTIEIAQDKIRSFTTDEAVNVDLAAGSTVLGKVEPTGDGIKVVASDGQMTAATGKVTAVWRQGGDSPQVKKLKEEADKKEHHWAYEASVAVAGRTGVTEKLDAALGFKATLASAQDKLIFAVVFNRATDNGVTTADRQFGSADYSTFYSPDNGWYVRTSAEKDIIKALDFRSSSSFGFGRKLIKDAHQDLELRLGLNYLYETYTDKTSFNSPGLDLALLHIYQFSNAKLVNAIAYTPSFKDFSNFRVHEESAVELPLGKSLWKLKFGAAFDYNSRPPVGTERLDITYFTSLMLNWH